MRVLFLVNQLLKVCGVSKHCFELLEGLRIYYPENSYFLITGGGNATENFEKLKIPIIINEKLAHERRTIFNYIYGIKFIKDFIRNNKIDIIHSHHHYLADIAQKASILLNTKTILTNHGILPNVGILNHYSAKQIVAVNQLITNYILEKKIKKNDVIELIRYGIRRRDYVKTKNNKIKFIAASRIVYDKGLDVYIKAINLLPPEYRKKADFFIAGEGESNNDIVKLDNELSTGVIFLGAVDDMQQCFNDTDVFVIPTRSKSEGFPTALIEAGLQKNLVITSDFWGLRDIFIRGEDGFVFEVENYAELAKQFKYVIEQYNSLTYLKENFHKKVLDVFNFEKMIQNYISLYNRVLI